MVVAQPSYRKFRKKEYLPLGMRVAHHPLKSQRRKVRGRHYFGSRSLVNAHWDRDGLHSLRTPKLAVVLNGEITFQCGDSILYCLPEHIIFIPPDTPHSDGSHTYLEETDSPQGDCDLLFIGAHADGIVVWLSVTRKGEHYTRGTYRILGRQAERYFDLLWEQVISTKKYSRWNTNALLMLLMTSIHHDLQEHYPLQIREERVDSSVGDRIMRAKEYMHNHIHKKLTIDEVARHVYLARTQFTTLFRRETGQSFHEYLSDYRFEKAKALLLNPVNLPVNRISERVGLRPGMLRKLFHQRLKMTPSQFRLSQRNGRM